MCRGCASQTSSRKFYKCGFVGAALGGCQSGGLDWGWRLQLYSCLFVPLLHRRCVTRARANAINFVFNFQFVLVLLQQQKPRGEVAAVEGSRSSRLGWPLASSKCGCSRAWLQHPFGPNGYCQVPSFCNVARPI